MERTLRLGLPMLVGGQAGKEITHNEALLLLDALVGGVVDGVGVNAPPAEAELGRCWIVGAAPTGAWAGQAGAVSCRTDGGWRFVPAREGLTMAERATGLRVEHRDGAWHVGEVAAERLLIGGLPVVGRRQPAIAGPVGGPAVDSEARATLGAVLEALRTHGLIEA